MKQSHAENLVMNENFIKKLVLAWDSDFTKVTAEETKQIEEAECSGFISDDEIDWDSIGTDT